MLVKLLKGEREEDSDVTVTAVVVVVGVGISVGGDVGISTSNGCE